MSLSQTVPFFWKNYPLWCDILNFVPQADSDDRAAVPVPLDSPILPKMLGCKMYIFNLAPMMVRCWIKCTHCMHWGLAGYWCKWIRGSSRCFFKVLLEHMQWELTVKVLKAVMPYTVGELLMLVEMPRDSISWKSTSTASISFCTFKNHKKGFGIIRAKVVGFHTSKV